jgi:hypothetical protein
VLAITPYRSGSIFTERLHSRQGPVGVFAGFRFAALPLDKNNLSIASVELVIEIVEFFKVQVF